MELDLQQQQQQQQRRLSRQQQRKTGNGLELAAARIRTKVSYWVSTNDVRSRERSLLLSDATVVVADMSACNLHPSPDM
jgi:hypothetical protein